ncbi:chromate resistance protein ChrB domain-containing protein [Caldimonas tepidiphila]|uniref:chromate resistance protein ChrB domain-containing protein n=1 Tax=Caldimonas tepidiphila TaxID=2315841 RepID=UPI001F0BD2C8|nr:chromate resistance protein ChrB domain-containing protein [Caldimonas tepidiphila]
MLLLTLPSQPNAVRLRTWRTLKALGAASLRDGAYVLPAEHAEPFGRIADEVRSHQGAAWLLGLSARSPAQQQELVALFDRSAAYAEWETSLEALRRELAGLGETAARRQFRGMTEALEGLERSDYFPGAARERARSTLALLRREIDLRFSKGEPAPAGGDIPRRDRLEYAGRLWATRARPWVDRLACCWLIRRFIDPAARFVWLRDVADLPDGALGFDFDGAAFSHAGSLVTFETMVLAFGLQDDARLRRIGATVHYLDVGGLPVAEAAGLENILSGLRTLHPDDDRLIDATGAVFDALYASSGEPA